MPQAGRVLGEGYYYQRGGFFPAEFAWIAGEMLFILLLLFLPCAIVGAFVTAEDQDLTAFQTAFSFRPPSGVLHGRSDAVAKDRSPSGAPAPSYSGVTRRTDNAPAVSVRPSFA